MKCNPPPRAVLCRGVTLIELTVTILVLLFLLTIVFMGSRAWKRGSDRAACVLNMRNVQMATRSYQNMYGYSEGTQPETRYGTRDIARHLVENGFITRDVYEMVNGGQSCPGGGLYNCPAPDIFPLRGRLYLQCSLSASEEHEPGSVSVVDW